MIVPDCSMTNLGTRGNSGATQLFVAAFCGRKGIAMYLIAKWADEEVSPDAFTIDLFHVSEIRALLWGTALSLETFAGLYTSYYASISDYKWSTLGARVFPKKEIKPCLCRNQALQHCITWKLRPRL